MAASSSFLAITASVGTTASVGPGGDPLAGLLIGFGLVVGVLAAAFCAR